jgi:hypothetical protein
MCDLAEETAIHGESAAVTYTISPNGMVAGSALKAPRLEI